MEWLSSFLALFGSGSGGGSSGGGGVSSFSTSTSATGRTGEIIQDFGNAPIYNQSALGALEKVDPIRLAVAGIVLFGLVLAWRKR
jgi:hypothetical protein